MSDLDQCSSPDNTDTFFHLRVASLFIILVTSSSGALFPVLAQRTRFLNVPPIAFAFAKYFGSGVIIATAFIHLLGPALDELGSPCLSDAWQTYPYALAISMLGVFGIFFVELIAFRWGTSRLKALGIGHDVHGHGLEGGSHAAHGPEAEHHNERDISRITDPPFDLEKASASPNGPGHSHNHDHDLNEELDPAIAQVLGIAILEFGVVLHSVLIGLTLAVDPGFKVLFVVIVFHQMFEGLGLGSRLALMKLPPRFNLVPIFGAVLYGVTTPIGIAIGLGIRSSYNPQSATASIVSGVMDALSSGILLYTGLVELLAHEFLFNPLMHRASTRHIVFACSSVVFGAFMMALLGRWA